MAPRRVIEEERPWKVRVTRTDGTSVEIDRPIVLNDSIVPMDEVSVATRIPLADVLSLEVRRGSAGRSVGFVLRFVVVLLGGGIVAGYDGSF